MSNSEKGGTGKTPAPGAVVAPIPDLTSTLASALPEAAKAVLEEVARTRPKSDRPAEGSIKPEPILIADGTPPPSSTKTPPSSKPPSVRPSERIPISITASSSRPRSEPAEGPPRPAANPPNPEDALLASPSIGSDTLIGGTAPVAPPPIVPRRRTPASGTAAQKSTTLIGAAVAPPFRPKLTPAAGTVSPASRLADLPPPVIASKQTPQDPIPVIRIPQGGYLGSSAAMMDNRPRSMLCEILLRNGAVSQVDVDRAFAIQEERGGQIGRILVSLGACGEEAIARALIDQLKERKKSGYITDVSAAARENKDVAGLKVLTRPAQTVLVLLAADVFSLLLAAFVATGVHWARTYSELGGIDWTSWLVVGPAIGLCVLTYLGLELYSPMAKSTPDEIRDVVFATSLVHLGASLLSTLGDLPIVKWGVFVRGVWWLATLCLVPIVRSLVRNLLCTQSWWGIPVCVLGAAKTGRLIVRTLKAQPRSGLKPVMMLDDDAGKHGTLRASFTNEVMDVYSVNVSAAHFLSDSQHKALSDDIFGGGTPPDSDMSTGPISSDHIPSSPPSSWHSRVDTSGGAGSDDNQFLGPESRSASRRETRHASAFPRGKFAEVEGVPIVGDLSLAPILAQRLKIPYAVLAMPGVDSPKLLQIVERVGGKFSHLLVIPDLFGFATLGVPAKNLGGILGVEVRQQLLLPGPRLAKRVMDVALTSIGIFFVLPFLLLIGLLIKLDSAGPIFYTQKRLGRDGEFFKAYKFRTMHGDGEERLKAILDADPALKAEYEIYHKLKKDPRVTRIGRVLRKFSLDEFPQLLNVVNGDMSLVGPRPYIEREVAEMGGQEKIILRAPPGMTGMWQVSDRNSTSFAQRCQIDVYYVRNWSPWLDIHILAKTFGVVIKGTGS